MLASIRQQLQHSGGQFIQRSFLLAVGFAIARFFGLFYSLLLGRVLSTEDYGYVQYSILLAGLIGIGTQPLLQHTLARMVSVYREDTNRLNGVITTTFALTAVVTLLSIVVTGVGFLVSGTFNAGALIVFLGVTIYYSFYGIARGFEDSNQLSLVFIASNVVQFIALLVVYFVIGTHDTLPALAIYGLSYVGPVLYLAWSTKTPIVLQPGLIRRDTASEIVRFSVPLWLSHALYAFGSAGDVFLLAALAGQTAAGAFVFNRTLCIVFDFLPSAIGTIIMPRVAAGASPQRLTQLSIAAVIASSTALGVVFLALYPWVMPMFFSPSYQLPMMTMVLMIVAAALYGVHGILTNVAVGNNQASVEFASRTINLVLLYGLCYVLIPSYGVLGAAIANVMVAAVVVGTFPLLTMIHARIANRRPPADSVA